MPVPLTQASSTYASQFYLREPEADLAWVKKSRKSQNTESNYFIKKSQNPGSEIALKISKY